uniref:Uncharacterized protein n=1 Tax=Arundo donax TaxID=35708 RepID=A0A0A8ZIT2_ARUDO
MPSLLRPLTSLGMIIYLRNCFVTSIFR